MKKKIMLLPISLFPCLLGGCHHPVAHLSFSDILNEKANSGYIKISDKNDYDYCDNSNFNLWDVVHSVISFLVL